MKAARLIFASDLCSNIAKQTTPKTHKQGDRIKWKRQCLAEPADPGNVLPIIGHRLPPELSPNLNSAGPGFP